MHRIGRTGRAGLPGEAISLVSPEEIKFLEDIERIPDSVGEYLEGHMISAVVEIL